MLEREPTPIRQQIRNEIAHFPIALERDPQLWWRSTVKMLIRFRHKTADIDNEEIAYHVTTFIHATLEKLRSASLLGIVPPEKIIEHAEHMMMNVSMEMAKPFEKKDLDIESHFIPLNELVALKPDRFAIRQDVIGGVQCKILQVKHPDKDVWEEIPLPIAEKIWHKGGPARAVLDVIANAPTSMQKSEFPWNDFDVIIAGIGEEAATAMSIGVDSDGIEHLGDQELNFSHFCLGRDTQQNQICLGSEGLYYSQAALMSAITGHVNIVGEYIANKAIYGVDRMTIQKTTMAKQRGLMRLVKAVSEGKALSFDYIPFNANFDMGVYILFLAKRWSKKEKFPQLISRMYHLLKKMNQLRPGEADIFDVLERAHQDNPFFDFDSEVRYPIEVVRWKSRKIIKQFDRELAWKFSFPTLLEIKRTPGDDIPARISLEDFKFNAKDIDFKAEWQEFIKRSRIRTAAQKASEETPYQRFFGMSYEDTDGIGVDGDDVILLE